MTPEEIRKQMMGSAGVKEDDPETLYEKAEAADAAEDYSTAFRCAKTAADHGHVKAQNLVGMYYMRGDGVEEDSQSARLYFEKAAGSGDPQSKSWLAMMSYWGDAPEIDPARAAQLLSDAVAAGSVDDAFANLGLFYMEGRGVEKSVGKAVALFQEGVDRGDSQACFQMAKCYAQGLGVKKNLEKALELVKTADKQGFEPAGNLVAEIEAEIQGKPFANPVPLNPHIEKAVPAPPPGPAAQTNSAGKPKRKVLPALVGLAVVVGAIVSWASSNLGQRGGPMNVSASGDRAVGSGVSYRARIGPQDLVNSKGAYLPSIATIQARDILLQDRFNFHRPGFGDWEDSDEGIYQAGKEKMRKLFESKTARLRDGGDPMPLLCEKPLVDVTITDTEIIVTPIR